MAEEFDPYRKWLGIPQHEQPPTHYRLLGIAEFEDDPDVVQNAADRQMAHVRTFQHGQHSQLSQRLLNELATAKLTLLNPEKRAAYNESLTEQDAPEEVAEPAPPLAKPPELTRAPTVSKAPAPVPAATIASRSSVRQARRTSSMPLLLVVSSIGLAFAVLLAGAIMVAFSENSDTDKVVVVPPPAGGRTQPNTGNEHEWPQPSPGDTTEPTPTETAPATAATFEAALTAARQALAQRDEKAALEQLRLATQRARGEAEKASADQLHALYVFLQGFWSDVQAGARRLKDLDEEDETTVVYNGVDYELIELKGGRVRMRVDGRVQAWPLREAPLEVAMMLASQGGSRDDAAPIYQATFLLLDEAQNGRAGMNARRQRALELYCLALAQAGPNDALASELVRAGFGEEDFVPAVLPAEEHQVASDHGNGEEPEVEPAPGDEEEVAEGNTSGETDEVAEHDPEEVPADDDDPRLPVPTSSEMSAVRAVLEDNFRGDFAGARNPEAKTELANKLVLAAFNEKDDMVLRYCYLERARDVAIGLGDAKLMVEIVKNIGDHYRIETFDEQVRLMRHCSSKVVDPLTYGKFTEQTLDLCLQAIEIERLDVIEELMQDLQRAASSGGSPTDPDRALATAQWIDEYSQILPLFEEAQATLKENPDDPDANLVAGTYYCFFEENWQKGLECLAKSSDNTLRQLATDDDKVSNEARDRVNLADRWYQQAQAGGVAGMAMLKRAVYHYGRAVGRLQRNEKVAMQQKIQQLEAFLQSRSAYMPRD